MAKPQNQFAGDAVAALVVPEAQEHGMTTQGPNDKRTKILPGTPAMSQYLSVGYGGMTIEEAETIIRERAANPDAWPFSEYKKALAFREAYYATPRAIDTSPGYNQEPKVSA